MAHADELLTLAQHLAEFPVPGAEQASLRRAVSTAYYALFHLLISEATRNWEKPEFRHDLGRVFEHGKMKSASSELRSRLDSELAAASANSPARAALASLRRVAAAFIDLQYKRNQADYNTGYTWTPEDVSLRVRDATEAFASWRAIRDEHAAQAYLVALLGKRP